MGLLYGEVAAALASPPLSSHFDKSWSGHVGVKAALYDVQALADSGAALHADDNIAAEIARLRVRFWGTVGTSDCVAFSRVS